MRRGAPTEIMATLAAPVRSYLQNTLVGQTALVCELSVPQLIYGPARLGQNATMTAPWTVGQSNITPYLQMVVGDNLVNIQLFKGTEAFEWQQTANLTLAVTGPNGFSENLDLRAHIDPNLGNVNLPTTPAMFPSGGTYNLTFSWDWAGNHYISDTTVLQLLRGVIVQKASGA